jgi:hypothetical protein
MMDTGAYNETMSDTGGSNHHPPVLIPITFQSTTTPPPAPLERTDFTRHHDNKGDSIHQSHNDNKNDQHHHKRKQQLQEWAMIEINGELLIPPLSSASSATMITSTPLQDDSAATFTTSSTSIFDTRNNVELGSISFETPSKSAKTDTEKVPPVVPIMIIGTHELRGTIIELQRPFLCLQKHVIEANGNNGDAATATTSTTEYVVRGIVKYKFIFNQYPKTIMR